MDGHGNAGMEAGIDLLVEGAGADDVGAGSGDFLDDDNAAGNAVGFSKEVGDVVSRREVVENVLEIAGGERFLRDGERAGRKEEEREPTGELVAEVRDIAERGSEAELAMVDGAGDAAAAADVQIGGAEISAGEGQERLLMLDDFGDDGGGIEGRSGGGFFCRGGHGRDSVFYSGSYIGEVQAAQSS